MVLTYIARLVICNLVGASLTIFVAMFVFFSWDEDGSRSFLSLANESFQVSFFLLLPIGIIYSLVTVTPIFFALRNRVIFRNLALLVLALFPSVVFAGSMSWDIMALCFGLSAFLCFIKVVLGNEN